MYTWFMLSIDSTMGATTPTLWSTEAVNQAIQPLCRSVRAYLSVTSLVVLNHSRLKLERKKPVVVNVFNPKSDLGSTESHEVVDVRVGDFLADERVDRVEGTNGSLDQNLRHFQMKNANVFQ